MRCWAFCRHFTALGFGQRAALPLLSGFRVVRHPDPTDAGGLLRNLAAYQPLSLVGTPTFVSYILGRPGRGTAFLRMIVVGAEKCPRRGLRPVPGRWLPARSAGRVRHHRMLAGGGGQ